MNDLVIHVGLPKTGTTTLQRRFFKDNINYFGIGAKRGDGLADELLDLFLDYSLGKSIHGAALKWKANVLGALSERGAGSMPVLISSEFFFEGHINEVPEFPLVKPCEYSEQTVPKLIGFVDYINRDIWVGKVKVIVTFRDEIEWLASKYVQASNKILFASQSDFERRMQIFMSSKNQFWIDWMAWLECFAGVLGEDNVVALSQKEISNEEFF